jgi:hypothetical protein
MERSFMRYFRALPAAAAVILLAGCDSNPTTPTVDVDAALSQMSSNGIATYSGAAASASTSGLGSLASPSVPAANAANCPYNTSTEFFVCDPITSSGVTFSRSFQLLDAQGVSLSTANPLLVASIRSVIDIDGTVTPPNGAQLTTEITRHEDATLSGIQSTSRVLNGSATQRLAMTGSSFSFVSNDTSATADLLLPSTPQQKYPLGGTITTNRTISTSGVAATSLHQSEEISFDGTSVMTVKIMHGTEARTCLVNLATPGVAPSCS